MSIIIVDDNATNLLIIEKLINYYFTAIYLVLDTDQKTIEYVNAGHPAGMIQVDGELASLTEGCCEIGFFDNIDIRKGSIQYEQQVKVVLFTDGLLEWIGDDQEDGTLKLNSTRTWPEWLRFFPVKL